MKFGQTLKFIFECPFASGVSCNAVPMGFFYQATFCE